MLHKIEKTSIGPKNGGKKCCYYMANMYNNFF